MEGWCGEEGVPSSLLCLDLPAAHCLGLASGSPVEHDISITNLGDKLSPGSPRSPTAPLIGKPVSCFGGINRDSEARPLHDPLPKHPGRHSGRSEAGTGDMGKLCPAPLLSWVRIERVLITQDRGHEDDRKSHLQGAGAGNISTIGKQVSLLAACLGERLCCLSCSFSRQWVVADH